MTGSDYLSAPDDHAGGNSSNNQTKPSVQAAAHKLGVVHFLECSAMTSTVHFTVKEALSGIFGSISLAAWIFVLVI